MIWFTVVPCTLSISSEERSGPDRERRDSDVVIDVSSNSSVSIDRLSANDLTLLISCHLRRHITKAEVQTLSEAASRTKGQVNQRL